MLISLAEYAANHGKAPDTVRQMVLRGNLAARKIGRNWVIEDNEPYPDNRVKSGKYIKNRGERKMTNTTKKAIVDRIKSGEMVNANVIIGDMQYRFLPDEHSDYKTGTVYGQAKDAADSGSINQYVVATYDDGVLTEAE